MARTGGRNTGFAWFVGIVIAAFVGALVWFAVPAFPGVAVWVGDQYRNATGAGTAEAEADATPTAEPTEAPAAAFPADCAAMYPETLWALLQSTSGVQLAEDAAIPGSAQELAQAIDASDPVVCHWRIPTGQGITTLVAKVADDASDVAATYLGSRRFACTTDGIRTACSRDADGRIVTHEVRSGVWTMSVQDGWRPPRYSDDVAARIWPG
jgi:hypothetical protein